MAMLDIQSIRSDFPILQTQVDDNQLIYFDNAATTQKPQVVIETIKDCYLESNANIHRGAHYLSDLATEKHENARKRIQKFLGVSSSSEIIFTKGTTDSINLVASSFIEGCMSPGDEVILSVLEHHSNIVPWQIQAHKKGISLKFIPIDENCNLRLDILDSLFSARTKLVSIGHISNAVGIINPIEEVIKIAHERGVPVLLDGAQAIPHKKINLRELDVDFYAFSGHKVYGPTGIGVLYAKEKWLNKMPPYQGGGAMISTVTLERTTYSDLPYKFEAGTPDYIGSVALAKALSYIDNIGLDAINAYENELLWYAYSKLKDIDGVQIIGDVINKSAIISFLLDGIHPHDAGILLNKYGIATRIGAHCCQPLMKELGIDGTIRASFSFYNTHQEIDRFVDSIEWIRKILLR